MGVQGVYIDEVAVTGRRSGKTASLDALTKLVAGKKKAKEPGEVWLNEPTEQTMAKMREAKTPLTRAERKFAKRTTRNACPHAVVRHKLVPHPKYGTKVPHFVSWVSPMVEPHPCVRPR